MKGDRISKLKMLDISPGDGGTDLGRAIYDTIFPSANRFDTIKKMPDQQLQTTPQQTSARAVAIPKSGTSDLKHSAES